MSISVFSDWKYNLVEKFQKHLSRADKTRIFTYIASNVGQTFVLDLAPDANICYMTSQQAGVQLGDRIQIYAPDKVANYQIQEIEYYEKPSDAWIAKLQKIATE